MSRSARQLLALAGPRSAVGTGWAGCYGTTTVRLEPEHWMTSNGAPASIQALHYGDFPGMWAPMMEPRTGRQDQRVPGSVIGVSTIRTLWSRVGGDLQPSRSNLCAQQRFADACWFVEARVMRQWFHEIIAWSDRGYSLGPGNDKRKVKPPYFAIRSGQPPVSRLTGDLWRRSYFSGTYDTGLPALRACRGRSMHPERCLDEEAVASPPGRGRHALHRPCESALRPRQIAWDLRVMSRTATSDPARQCLRR
jgi:hypothetical protein